MTQIAFIITTGNGERPVWRILGFKGVNVPFSAFSLFESLFESLFCFLFFLLNSIILKVCIELKVVLHVANITRNILTYIEGTKH